MSWYFGEIKGGAYPYEVQNSEDAVEVGVLAYTSNHSNQFHLEQSLHPTMKVRDPVTRTVRDLKIGVVPKMHKDFPKSDKNWDIPTEWPLIIYADRADSKAVRCILYQAFNHEPDFMKRPGYLNSRLIPSKDFLSVGSDAARNWDCLIQKHQQVLLLVPLLRTTNIKHVDVPVTANGSTHMLREELLNVRYPLGSSMADTPERFFFAVDWADRGRNLEAGPCYLPVYSDCLQVATTFTRILPVYILDLLGPEVARKWFKPTAVADCQEVQLTKDDDGQWTGGWTTDKDGFDLDILEEDMGDGNVTLDLAGAALPNRTEPDEPVHATADDATAYTFEVQVFGRASAGQQTATQSGANEMAPQWGEVAPTESSAAAAPSENPPKGGRPAGHGPARRQHWQAAQQNVKDRQNPNTNNTNNTNTPTEEQPALCFADDKLVYFGNFFGPKCPNVLRLVSLNHGGLLLEPKGPFETALFQSIQTNEIDILLLQELGCNWSKMGRHGQWRERVNHALNPHCTQTRCFHNARDLTGNHHQWGGMGILTHGPMSHFAMGTGCDKAKLDRWTWARYRGKNGMVLHCVSVYRQFPTPPEPL